MLKKVNAFGIGMTFTGVIVGAGFATDQELLQFYGGFGSFGFLGIFISGAFFALYAALIMLVTRRLNTDNYNLIIVPGGNRFLTIVVDIIMAFLMLLIFCVMVVGAGAQFNQFFGWDPLVGSIIMTVISVITVFWGSESLLSSFNIVVPIMVGLGVVISVASLFFAPNGVHIADPTGWAQPNALVGNWFLSALLYVLYNMLGGVVSLPNLGIQAKSTKQAVTGAILGGVTIAILAACLFMGVMSNAGNPTENAPNVIQSDMPMLAVAKSLSVVTGPLYMFVLFAAIYTTASGFMFGMKARLDNFKKMTPKLRNILLIVIGAAALLGTRVGFVNLIATVYPTFGYIGMLIFVLLLVNYFYSKAKKAKAEVAASGESSD